MIDLQNVLYKHLLWLNDQDNGARAVLRNADLHKADLRYADLRNADLHKANLQEANLHKANLQEADLRYANLCNADLRNADLCNADLRYANLCNADLHKADLRYADLRNADLDFSCLPLRCGGSNIKADKRFIAQLAWHLASMDISNCGNDVKEAVEAFRKMPMSQWFAEYRNDLPKLPS